MKLTNSAECQVGRARGDAFLAAPLWSGWHVQQGHRLSEGHTGHGWKMGMTLTFQTPGGLFTL